MSLKVLLLLLILVISAAGLTVWLGSVFLAQSPGSGAIAIPALMAAFVVWRLIAARFGGSCDDK